MWPKRITFGLAGLACLLVTGLTAFAQEGVRDLPAMQLFDPADIRPYDNWNPPKEGFFFSFDGIWWTISAPKKTTVGAPGLTAPVDYVSYYTDNSLVPPVTYQVIKTLDDENTFDTGDFRAKQKDGDRIEFGYTGEHHGFLVDTFELNGQTQYVAGDQVHVMFHDPQGYLIALNDALFHPVEATVHSVPVEFYSMSVCNQTYTDGIEALYTYRQHQFENGGQLQWMFGGRYVRFDDDFNVVGTGGVLDTSSWDTTARNRIAGPEIGVRYFQQFGRLALSTEGRFMAGINSQDIRQYGTIASNLNVPITLSYYAPTTAYYSGPLTNSFASSLHKTEFTPLAEFRVEGHVQLTRLISFKVGWTGIFMDGIARAADMVNYTLPNMGILTTGNRQTVFMQGVNVGVELNR